MYLHVLDDRSEFRVDGSDFFLECHYALGDPLELLGHIMDQLAELREVIVGARREVHLVSPGKSLGGY